MKFFWKYAFPPLYGLVFYTILRLVSDLTTEDKFWLRSFRQNASEIVVVVLSSYLLVRLPSYFNFKFAKRNSRQHTGAIFLEFGEVLLTAIVLATVLSSIAHVMARDYPIGIDDLVIVNVLLSLFILLHYAILPGQ